MNIALIIILNFFLAKELKYFHFMFWIVWISIYDNEFEFRLFKFVLFGQLKEALQDLMRKESDSISR